MILEINCQKSPISAPPVKGFSSLESLALEIVAFSAAMIAIGFLAFLYALGKHVGSLYEAVMGKDYYVNAKCPTCGWWMVDEYDTERVRVWHCTNLTHSGTRQKL